MKITRYGEKSTHNQKGKTTIEHKIRCSSPWTCTFSIEQIDLTINEGKKKPLKIDIQLSELEVLEIQRQLIAGQIARLGQSRDSLQKTAKSK